MASFNPQSYVQALFESTCQLGSSELPRDADFGISTRIRRNLQGRWLEKVPDVSSSIPPDVPACGKLVKLRMLVRDTENQEFYTGAARVSAAPGQPPRWVTSKFSDGFAAAHGGVGSGQSGENAPPGGAVPPGPVAIWARAPVLCSPLPGVASWCHAEPFFDAASPPGFGDDAGGKDGADVRGGATGGECVVGAEAAHHADNDHTPPWSAAARELPGVTRGDGAAGSSDEGAPAVSSLEGEPLDGGDPSSHRVMVLLYDGDDKEVRPHDIIEAVGVLSPTPRVYSARDLDDDFDDAETDDDADCGGGDEDDVVESAWVVHALLARRIAPAALSPYDGLLLKRSMQRELTLAMRAKAVEWLAFALGGDALAGEVLLLQLLCRAPKQAAGTSAARLSVNIHGLPEADVSKPHVSTRAAGHAPGMSCSHAVAASMLPAAVDGWPVGAVSEAAAAVTAAIAAVYPCVSVLPLTDKALASPALLPRNPSGSGRLQPGALQLPPLSAAVFDETCGEAAPATLGAQSACFQTFLREGVVLAQYPHAAVRLQGSAGVTVLSARRSAFGRDCHFQLPIRAASALPSAAEVASAAADYPIQGIRAYLASAWRLSEGLSFAPDLPSSTRGGEAPPGGATSWIQARLVQESGKLASLHSLPKGSLLDESLHRFSVYLSLTSALAVSRGDAVVTSESWAEMKALNGRVAARTWPVASKPAHDQAAAASTPQPAHAPVATGAEHSTCPSGGNAGPPRDAARMESGGDAAAAVADAEGALRGGGRALAVSDDENEGGRGPASGAVAPSRGEAMMQVLTSRGLL